MNRLSVLVTVTILCITPLYFLVPLWNAQKLEMALDPLFEEFQMITSVKYPDKQEKELAFRKVLEKKADIVKKNTILLVSCEASFIAHNPGTIHRKDVQNISCSW